METQILKSPKVREALGETGARLTSFAKIAAVESQPWYGH